MPTYEYLCQTCNNRFEKWQKMTDEPLTVCPECGGHIRRVFYPAGLVFKGSGFYKTDHSSSSASSNGNSHAAKSEATSETKSSGESTSTESSTGSSSASENKAPATAGTK